VTCRDKTCISVHSVGMELNLTGLPNSALHVTGFSGEDGMRFPELMQCPAMVVVSLLVCLQ
jgi:hypothetical protein